MARINSLHTSAFSNVAWLPTLVPSTVLGKYTVHFYIKLIFELLWWWWWWWRWWWRRRRGSSSSSLITRILIKRDIFTLAETLAALSYFFCPGGRRIFSRNFSGNTEQLSQLLSSSSSKRISSMFQLCGQNAVFFCLIDTDAISLERKKKYTLSNSNPFSI